MNKLLLDAYIQRICQNETVRSIVVTFKCLIFDLRVYLAFKLTILSFVKKIDVSKARQNYVLQTYLRVVLIALKIIRVLK